jgi:D-alanyl-D-alanine carboxypeptidase/D-alanyl-D-alanine-endopeptidase (penicillin-binding protein 4)
MKRRRPRRRPRPHLAVAALLPAVFALWLCTVARADLAGDVRKAMQNKAVKADRLGIEIIELGDGTVPPRTVFAHNAAKPLGPASNLKVVTTAAALELLGRDFRFRTMLAVRPVAGSDGTFDVAIIGDGDPTLGDAEMLSKLGWGVDTVFVNWAGVLKQRGITRVRNVCVDDSVFDETFVHPNWPAEQQHKRYVAQVGGVNLNANCVDFFLRVTGYGEYVTYATDPATDYISVSNVCVTGNRNAVWLARDLGRNSVVLRGETDASNTVPISVTVHDPSMFGGTVFAETLRKSGIQIDGEVLRDRSIRHGVVEANTAARGGGGAERWIPTAVHETPIGTVLARANKDSMNLYAEALCKRIGHTTSGASGSWETGTAAIAAFVQSLGVDTAEFVIDDGCGLSKKNAISANAIAQVLAHEFAGDKRQAFLDSLSVAGTDGTLDKRFRDSDLRGRVFGKTGYILGVSSLSGYVRTRDDQWYCYSILMNGVSDVASAKLVQEQIVKAMDNQTPRVTDGR